MKANQKFLLFSATLWLLVLLFWSAYRLVGHDLIGKVVAEGKPGVEYAPGSTATEDRALRNRLKAIDLNVEALVLGITLVYGLFALAMPIK